MVFKQAQNFLYPTSKAYLIDWNHKHKLILFEKPHLILRLWLAIMIFWAGNMVQSIDIVVPFRNNQTVEQKLAIFKLEFNENIYVTSFIVHLNESSGISFGDLWNSS